MIRETIIRYVKYLLIFPGISLRLTALNSCDLYRDHCNGHSSLLHYLQSANNSPLIAALFSNILSPVQFRVWNSYSCFDFFLSSSETCKQPSYRLSDVPFSSLKDNNYIHHVRDIFVGHARSDNGVKENR